MKFKKKEKVSRKRKWIRRVAKTLIFLILLGGGIYMSLVDSMGKLPAKERYRDYGIKGNTFTNIETVKYKWDLKAIGEMFGFFLKSRKPSVPLPVKSITAEDFPKTPGDLNFVWVGHSTVIVEIEGKRLLLDPVFGNASPVPGMVGRFQKPPIEREELPHIDLVLISHDHYDHLEKETAKMLISRGVEFVVPSGVEARLEGWGCPGEKITVFKWWQSEQIKGLEITAAPSKHFSGRSLTDRNKTLWCSWVVKGSNKSFFYSGDGGYSQTFREIGKRFGPFDIAFMENGAWGRSWADIHMTPEQSVEAFKDVRGKYMVPVHWSVFDLALHSWSEPAERVFEAAGKEGVKLIMPVMGEYVEPGETGRPKWWRSVE